MEILKYTIIIVFALIFISCGDDENKIDKTQPRIHLNSPISGARVNTGGILKVKTLISDDKALANYVVEINYRGAKSSKNIEEFYFSSFTDSDAYGKPLPELAKGEKSFNLSFDIAVEDNVCEGDYNFILTVIDQSGNSTEEMVQFKIVRP